MILITPMGSVFAFHMNDWLGRYSAVGPLVDGKSVVKLDAVISVHSFRQNINDARDEILTQLVAMGY